VEKQKTRKSEKWKNRWVNRDENIIPSFFLQFFSDQKNFWGEKGRRKGEWRNELHY